MPAQAALYLRDGKVIVVPQAEGRGASFDVEPIRVVESDAEAVTAAITDALVVSSRAPVAERAPEDLAYSSPVLDLVKARSFRHFYRGATHCRVVQGNRELAVHTFDPAPDRGGFEPTEDEPRVVEDLAALGMVVIECLERSRKMPPA
jgi:hypothetical protein